MKNIYSIITAIALSAAFFFGVVDAEAASRGEKTFGVRTGYVSRNKSADAGLFFQYTFSEHFRLQPAADIVFRHDDRDAFMIDLNAQVPFAMSTPNFSLYPFAGLNYSSWNYHSPMQDTEDRFSDDVTTRKNRFGVNLGAGFDLKLSETLKLNLEAGYTLVKSNSALRILVGIGYVF